MMSERLALGTVQFGLNYGIANSIGIVSESELEAILDLARKAGIDTLDTAIAYGSSEERLGASGINDWQVVTKLPSIPLDADYITRQIRAKVNESLERLKITRLFGLLLHSPNQLLEEGGMQIYEAFTELKNEGIVSKIGYSVYEPHDLDRLCHAFPPDIVQLPLNILDRRFINTGWIKQLKESSVDIHSRSAFLQGLLLMPPGKRPEKFNYWKDLWKVWDSFLAQTGLTAAQACLNFVHSISELNKVVIGVDSATHLNEILDIQLDTSISFPAELSCEDTWLLNPSNWESL
jgi:aryl-alcohol dehydrogenase-like predicted oxidoreductase